MLGQENGMRQTGHCCDCNLDGLTKREWFAGQALVGLIAGSPNVPTGQSVEQKRANAVKAAVRLADLLLEELAK